MAVAVVDAEAAAGVDVADVVAVFAEVGDEAGDAGEGCGEGIDLADLRADVDADAGGVEPFGFCGFAVDGAGDVDVDAELVLAEAGGDVGVGLGEDVGVDAEGEAGADVESFGAGGEEVEFGLGLDVEEEDVGVEGGVDLPDLLAYAGEDDFFEGGFVGFADALEFAAGDDVEACSLLREEAEDGERGVGFDGVADGVGTVREGCFEELEAVRDLPGGVDVERRAVLVGEGGEAGFVAVQGAVAVGEGAGADLVWCCLFSQNLNALCREYEGFFGDDDPGGDVGQSADSGEDDQQGGDDADEVEVPAIL